MDEYREQLSFTELVLLALQGDISSEQMEELDTILKSGPEKVRAYVEMMDMCVEMSSFGSVDLFEEEFEINMNVFKALAEEERIAPAIEISKEQVVKPFQKNEPVKITHQFPKSSFIVLLTSVAALLLLIAFVMLSPEPPAEVATILEMNKEVEWDDSSDSPNVGTRLYTRQPLLSLKKGILKIGFDHGADIVIEAPAVFSIESDKVLYLLQGRLHTHVKEYGAGFAVRTPSSYLVDIGTEFGVDVYANGDSQLHVLKGEVVLTPGTEKNPDLKPISLKAGQAVEVSYGTFDVRTVAFRENFMDSIVEPIDPPIFFEDFESLPLAILSIRDGWAEKPVLGGSLLQVVKPGLFGSQGLKFIKSTEHRHGSARNRLPMAYDPATMTKPLYVSVIMKWNGTDVTNIEKNLCLGFNDGVENGHTNKIQARFYIDRGILAFLRINGQAVYYSDGSADGTDVLAGGRLSANTRYLCVVKFTPKTRTSGTFSAGFLDITNSSLSQEGDFQYQFSIEIDPSSLIAKGTNDRYYLKYVDVALNSESVLVDNLIVCDNWNTLQSSIQGK